MDDKPQRRTVDGRTLFVLLKWATAAQILMDTDPEMTVPEATKQELAAATANVKAALESVHFTVEDNDG